MACLTLCDLEVVSGDYDVGSEGSTSPLTAAAPGRKRLSVSELREQGWILSHGGPSSFPTF